jgi:hypothetical protein
MSVERYVGMLLDKLEAQPGADAELCDRIERALGFGAPKRKPVPVPASLPPRSVEISDVIDVVARRFNVEPAALIGTGRAQPETGARQLAMRVAREMTGKSYPEIGRAFNRDHTTVIHACEVTEGMATGDIREELEART